MTSTFNSTVYIDLLSQTLPSVIETEADIAEIIGASSDVVSQIVNGKRTISKAQVKALGHQFKVSPSLFI